MIPIRAPSGTTRSTLWSTGHVPYDLSTPTTLTRDISATKRTEPLGRRLERLQRRQDLVDDPDQSLEPAELGRILTQLGRSLEGLLDAGFAAEPLGFDIRMSPGGHHRLRAT